MRGSGKTANWKLSTLLRTQRYYDTAALVRLYEAHVLPTLEFPTPAVYHASTTTLDKLDRVQRHFLREVGLTAAEALLEHNLAPLQTRRDVALLGLVHRTVLKLGPAHFENWFFEAPPQKHTHRTRQQTRRHNRQLYDYLNGEHTELLRRSPLGLTRVYNELPQSAVDKPTVSAFQSQLQHLVKTALRTGSEHWKHCVNLRKPSLRQVAA